MYVHTVCTHNARRPLYAEHVALTVKNNTRGAYSARSVFVRFAPLTKENTEKNICFRESHLTEHIYTQYTQNYMKNV